MSGPSAGQRSRVSAEEPQRRNILICDDDRTTRYLLKRILVQRLNADVHEASNGLEALTHLTATPADFLILDLRMPVMDGPETLEAIRKSPAFAGLPIIVLTGETDAALVKQIIGLGVTDYLIKPVTRPATQERLERIIDNLRKPEAGAHIPVLATAGPRLTPGQTILVADGAADFREFCRLAIGRRFNVIEAATGIAALRVLQATSLPDAVLIGRSLPLLGADLLAAKIRELYPDGRIAIIAVSARSEMQALAATGLYDACLFRTFVPGAFEKQFDAFGPASTPLAALLQRLPDLRGHVISATELVVGLMMQMDVEPLDGPNIPFAPPYLVARVLLTASNGFEIEIGLRCTQSSGEAFALAMCGAPGGDEAIAELVNIVAGRVKSAISGQMTSTLGLPQVVTIGPGETDTAEVAELSARFGVTDTDHQLEVSLLVRDGASGSVTSDVSTPSSSAA